MTFPTLPTTTAQIRSNVPVIKTVALDGSEVVRSGAAQYFSISLSLRNLTETQQRAILGHIASVGGGVNAFDLVLPGGLSDTSTGRTDSLTTNATRNSGSTSVSVTGGPTSTIILNAGDYVKFGANKIYQVTADATTDGSGNATINIFPGLLETSNSGETVVTNAIPFNVRYLSDLTELSVGIRMLGNIDIDVKEVI